MYHLMQTSFPPLGAQQGGGDGVPLGHPGPGHLGDQLHPQDPLARGRLGPAQGELMSVLQLSSERSCPASSQPMTALHANCAQGSRACAHTDATPVKPLSLQGEGVRNLDHLLGVFVEGVELLDEGGHAVAVVLLAQVTQVANLEPRVRAFSAFSFSPESSTPASSSSCESLTSSGTAAGRRSARRHR